MRSLQGTHPPGLFPPVLFCFPLGLLLPVEGGAEPLRRSPHLPQGGTNLPLVAPPIWEHQRQKSMEAGQQLYFIPCVSFK